MHSTSPRTRLQKLVTAALAALFCLSAGSHTVAQSRSTRKNKYQVPPEYPQLAREMNLKGTARVMITVAADGPQRRRPHGFRLHDIAQKHHIGRRRRARTRGWTRN